MLTTLSKIFCLLGTTLMIIPGELVLAQEKDRVIVISEKVGQTIDLEERNYYGIFLASWNFHSAVIRRLPDGSYLAEITELTDGVGKTRTLPINQKTLDALRDHIENYTGPTRIVLERSPAPTAKEQPTAIPEDFRTTLQREDAVKQAWDRFRQQEKAFAKPILTPMDLMKIKEKAKEARKQAKILAQEKWTRERWREESRHDEGPTYRGSGSALGFTLGAAAGILIGKGLQERKLEKQEIETRQGEWGPYEEAYNCYSYDNKYAPHLGAAIGGIAGGMAGYLLSKKADKEYYILVPKEIRTTKMKTSTVGCLGGMGVVGPVMGYIAGKTLPVRTRCKAGEEDNFGWGHFLGGYIAGTMLGIIFFGGHDNRSKRKRLWEESLLFEEPESSLNYQFMPLDPTAFALLPRRLPSGEVIYEYRMDVLRVRF